jgi:hypothetical protein
VIKQQIGVPTDVFTSYGGTAQIFQDSQGSTPLLILAAVLTIYVVLGVLYESFIHPLTILSGLPAAALGALLALKVMGFDLSIIALIGLLMLIGIVKKNAIMMIDVALETLRTEKISPSEAIHEACIRRFRPIMMTTFCAQLGTAPAPRYRRGRRSDRLAGTDAVHHASHLRRDGPPQQLGQKSRPEKAEGAGGTCSDSDCCRMIPDGRLGRPYSVSSALPLHSHLSYAMTRPPK